MTVSQALLLLALLIVKHFICDFLFQTGRIAMNKHHPNTMESWFHAGMHALFAIIVLCVVGFEKQWYLGLASGGVHMLVDMAKGHINDRMFRNIETPTMQNSFWWILGADQMLHGLTYVAVVALIAGAS